MSAKAEVAFEVGGTLASIAAAFYASMFAGEHLSQLWFLIAGVIAGTVIAAVAGRVMGVDIGLSMREKILAHLCAAVIMGPLSLNVALHYLPGYEPDAIACAVGGLVAIFGVVAMIFFGKWIKKQGRKKMK